jgi:WD40 repeat protein
MEGTVRLWDLDTGTEMANAKGHDAYLRSVACSPVADKAVSGDEGGTIVLWEFGDDQLRIVRRIVGHSSGIRHNCLVWSSNGKWILSGGWDGAIRLWDAASVEAVFTGNPGYGRVVCLALSADGKLALSSYLNGPDQPVILWDLEAECEVKRFGVPGNPWHADRELHVASLDFSPNGQTALFGTAFGSVIWWDLRRWRQISHNVLFGETPRDIALGYVTFSADGMYAIAVGCDRDPVGENAKVRFWRLGDSGSSLGGAQRNRHVGQ